MATERDLLIGSFLEAEANQRRYGACAERIAPLRDEGEALGQVRSSAIASGEA